MEAITPNMLWNIALILLGTIPTYIAIKIMGSEAGILKVFFMKIILAAVYVGSALFIPEGALGIISAIAEGILEFILYKFVFDLSSFKVVITMVIEGVMKFLVTLALLALGIGIAFALY
jgi:hypothetical protein